MSGKYTQFDIDSGKVFGRTHGCGCCGSETEVTVEDIDAHIARLESDIVEAKKVRIVVEQLTIAYAKAREQLEAADAAAREIL